MKVNNNIGPNNVIDLVYGHDRNRPKNWVPGRCMPTGNAFGSSAGEAGCSLTAIGRWGFNGQINLPTAQLHDEIAII